MTRIFVYGTLKRGGNNHRHLAGQQFLGEGRTLPGFRLYSIGDYPGMVRSHDGTGEISGEIWEVTPECLTDLDRLEGVGENLYERVPVKLAPPFDRQEVETYLYLRSLEGRRPLGSVW